MNKKLKSISEFLTEDDLLVLTEEAFTSHNLLNFKVRRYKPLLTVAASVVLAIGVLNIDSISAKTEEMFSYVFGVGMNSTSNLQQYYILEKPIQVTDQLQIEAAYRYDDALTIILRGAIQEKEIELRIGNKRYNPIIKETITQNSVVSETEQPREQVEQTELTFESIKQQNDLVLIVGEEEVKFTLKQPAAIESEELISIPVEGSNLRLLPLNGNHTKFAIAYDAPNVGKYPWIPKTLGLFSDETGAQSYSTVNSMNSYEILVADSLPGEIERFDGTGISLTKEFKGIFNTPEITLPNPASGETLMIDEEFDIDGVKVVVHSISRNGEEVTILFNRETSFKPLSLILLKSNENLNSGGGGGGGDDKTVNMILSTVPSDAKTLTFKVEKLCVIIEESYEIIF